MLEAVFRGHFNGDIADCATYQPHRAEHGLILAAVLRRHVHAGYLADGVACEQAAIPRAPSKRAVLVLFQECGEQERPIAFARNRHCNASLPPLPPEDGFVPVTCVPTEPPGLP